jgi:16S rRNA C1402 (ribose-2'-O) methylase RsmI
MFEESIIGSAEEVNAYFKDNADKVRGEFVVIVEATS